MKIKRTVNKSVQPGWILTNKSITMITMTFKQADQKCAIILYIFQEPVLHVTYSYAKCFFFYLNIRFG